jgi:hypothetical protein
MDAEKFKTELVVSTNDELDSREKEELLHGIAREAEIEDDVQFGNPVVRKSVDPTLAVSLGILVVGSVNTLITLLNYLDEREAVGTGIVKTNDGQLVSIDKVDKTVVENNGGIVLGELEGDVIVYQEDPEAGPMELTQALNVHDNTGATGEKLQKKIDEATNEE